MRFEVPAESTPWGDPDWRERALSWMHEHAGATVLGTDEPRLRAWSITMRLHTSQGPVWFKANPPGSGFEPALTKALSEWVPGQVLTPLAIDATEGWSLLPDGGRIARDALALDRWEDLLRQYAALQRAVAAHVPELVSIGVPDLRADRLPDRFDQLVAATGADSLTSARPRLVDWCARLAASTVPASLDHSDLHGGQIFAPRTSGDNGNSGRFVFFDWGDASIGHPFATLLVVFRDARQRFGPEADLDRLRDAYLEPWTAEHPVAELRAAVDIAVRLGAIGRALSWWRIFPQAKPEAAEYDRTAALWLATALGDDPLG